MHPRRARLRRADIRRRCLRGHENRNACGRANVIPYPRGSGALDMRRAAHKSAAGVHP